MTSTNLLSFPTLVETPFIIATIGNYTFGMVEVDKGTNYIDITFPNFITSLTVTKINGQVNMYSLSMTYQISAGDDPNMLEHVFSEVSNNRKIILTYGDWSFPTHIYKEEEALITNVKSKVDFSQSRIIYEISAVSTALKLLSSKFTFPQVRAKGSTILNNLLQTPQYGITKVFPGMVNKKAVASLNLIPTDDAVIEVEQMTQGTVLDRLNQVVGSMKSTSDPTAVYGLVIIDDNKNELNGPYFKVVKTSASTSASTPDNTYSIDIGYPGDNFVTSFQLSSDEQWTILYNTAKESGVQQYLKRIDHNGKLHTIPSNSVTRNSELKTSSQDESWWRQVTSYPIQATIELKGLVRPSMLMQYLKINSYFYGQKHISSGLYNITKQVDNISASGYKTTLSLLRTRGDLDPYTYNMRG